MAQLVDVSASLGLVTTINYAVSHRFDSNAEHFFLFAVDAL